MHPKSLHRFSFRRLSELSSDERTSRFPYSSIVGEVGSIYTSAFDTTDPTIYNLNVHECIDELRGAWESPHPRSKITVYRLENCISVGAGLFLDFAFRPIRLFVSQQTEVEIQSARSSAYAYFSSGEMEIVEEDSIVLIKPGYANYGHWLTELLVQPIFLREVVDGTDPIVFVCDHKGAPIELYIDSLVAAGISEKRIAAYNFVPKLLKSAYVVVGHSRHGSYMSPAIVDALVKCQMRMVGRRLRRVNKRLYVRRSKEYFRRIANETEVAALLERHGFQTIEAEKMTFREQVELFSDCEIAVGVAGAGLTNICWQSKGTACIGLFPSSMPDTFFWWIAQHRNLRFADIRCKIVGADNWNGDIEAPLEILGLAISRAIEGNI